MKVSKYIKPTLLVLVLAAGIPALPSQYSAMQSKEPDEIRSFLGSRFLLQNAGSCALCNSAGCWICLCILPPHLFSSLSAAISDVILLPISLYWDCTNLFYYRPLFDLWRSTAASIADHKPFFVESLAGDRQLLNQQHLFLSAGPLGLSDTEHYDPSMSSHRGRRMSLLDIAAVSGNRSAVLILLAQGADPNLKGYANLTSPFYAIEADDQNIFAVLYSHGADIRARNSRGQDLLMYARDVGAYNMTHVLRAEYGFR